MTIQKNVTIDDVRAAMAGDGESDALDPFKTNARKINQILGRGSFGTIQKFIKVIRDEIISGTANEENKIGQAIKPDSKAIESIWNSIANMVHSKSLEAIASLNTDRDNLREELAVSNNDIEAQETEINRLENLAIRHDDTHKADATIISELTARLDEAHKQITRMEGLIERMNVTASATTSNESAIKSDRKPRTTITPEITEQVKGMSDKPVKDIADATGISVGSVKNILQA